MAAGNISDNLIWYKLWIKDVFKVKSKVEITTQNNYVATIKKLLIKENSPVLYNISLMNMHVFSGVQNKNELQNDVMWDRKIHGGGTQNPLIVKVNEQSTYQFYRYCKHASSRYKHVLLFVN
jgi:uncharacterized protein (UPF0303 family)